MIRKMKIGALILGLLCLQCSGKAETPSTDDSSKKETKPNAEEGLPPNGELNRSLEEAKVAVEAGDWPRARQLVAAGLKLTEGNDASKQVPRAFFLLALGDVERENSHEPEARRHYTDAMALFHVHKHAKGRFETFLSMAMLDARRGDYVAAERQLGEAEALIPELKDSGQKGVFMLHKGRLASRRLEYKKAYDEFLEAMRIFEAAGKKRLVAESLMLLANEEDALDLGSDCRRSLEKALKIYRDLEDSLGEVRALHRLAGLAEREQNYNKARQLLKEVLALYRELDQQSAAAKVKRHLNALPVSE